MSSNPTPEQIAGWQNRIETARRTLANVATEVGVAQMRTAPRSVERDDLDAYRTRIDAAADEAADAHKWGEQFVAMHLEEAS